MSEKSSPISEWSDQELINLVWLDAAAEDLPAERRRELPEYQQLAKKELLRRGFRFRQSGDTPELASFDRLLEGLDVKGGKATPQRIYVSDDEMDKLIGPRREKSKTRPKQSILDRLRNYFRTMSNDT